MRLYMSFNFLEKASKKNWSSKANEKSSAHSFLWFKISSLKTFDLFSLSFNS